MYKIITIGLIGLLFTSCKPLNISFDENVDKNLQVCKYLSNQYRDPNKILSRRTLNVCKKVNSVVGEGYVAKALYNLDRKEEANLIYNKINVKLNKECINSNSDACTILAKYYFNKKNSKESIKFSKIACDLKDGIGCNNLAYAYSQGAGVKKDEYKATPLYQKACQYGEMLGCTNLGLQYQYGKGTEKKLEESLLLYKNACNQDHGVGCELLGYMYETGKDFMKKNLNNALLLYEKSCELNSDTGCKQAGNMYYKGKGTTKNKSKAFSFYLKSCKLDNGISCKIIGDMYKTGEGIPKNIIQSKSSYEKSCKLENGQACDILYPNRNKNRFKELLIILGNEDEKNNFSPEKNIRRPFIEVEKGLVGDICLRSAIIANAFMNFEKKKKSKNELISKEYYVDILMIMNKQEVAIVFKTKIEGKKDSFKDDLPIIRYSKKDTDSIFNAFIKKLKEELKVDDNGVKHHKVSREILNFIFPKRFYEYLKEK